MAVKKEKLKTIMTKEKADMISSNMKKAFWIKLKKYLIQMLICILAGILIILFFETLRANYDRSKIRSYAGAVKKLTIETKNTGDDEKIIYLASVWLSQSETTQIVSVEITKDMYEQLAIGQDITVCSDNNKKYYKDEETLVQAKIHYDWIVMSFAAFIWAIVCAIAIIVLIIGYFRDRSYFKKNVEVVVEKEKVKYIGGTEQDLK